LDGTLLDSLPGIEHSVRAAFAECHLPLMCDDLRRLIGPPIRTILSRAGNIDDPACLDALEGAFRSNYDSEGWEKTRCFPNMGEVLRSLSERGHRLFVISNKPRHISLTILRRELVLDRFEYVITRDSRIPPYASKDEMLHALLEYLGPDHAEFLMVGDTIEDAVAAANNEIPFAWAAYGYGSRGGTQSFPIGWELNSLSQVLEITESHCDRQGHF
jgi:phosphoglycolate phosphatase